MDKEGGTISRPPLLIGPENYDYWKSKMMVFLKSIDSRTWKAVENGWEPPVVIDKDGKKTSEIKPTKDYSKDEDDLALGNSKALNAIFNGVDINMFRLVKRCTVAKHAWEILRKAHEGTSKVKLSKLQMLRTNFENLSMKEEETIHDFHMNILEFANSFDALGEPISDEKLVSKILRSLPNRFDMKVTAIEESQDLVNIQVDELIGSLQTYELGMNQRKEKKNKSLAFASNTREDEESNLESDESLSEAMVLLGRQFNRIMKRMDKKSKFNVPSIKLDINKQTNDQRRARSDEKTSQSEGVQCQECEGYGHIKAECPTFLKRQKKSLAITWSDEDDSEEETESGSTKHVNALTGLCESDAESCDETSYEELLTTYKDLFIRSNEVYKALEKQKKANCQLQAEKNECLNFRSPAPKPENVKTKKEWKEKENDVCLIAHTSLRASSRQDWYFDSGCSRHMTGVEGCLANLKSYATSYVTFGDGAKGEIKGIGNLINNGLPNLDNVLLVKGLTTNLISISQLCDQGMKVNFTKSECLVTNEEGRLLMKGVMSKDNCYLWVSEEENHLSTCLLSKEDKVKLWHKKMGHLHLRGLKKVIAEETIKGNPKLKIEEGTICGECQIGKQTMVAHPRLQHSVTSRALELLHIDLMAPMQTENLGGKRYVFALEDDFSRFTWIDFLREKSDSFETFRNLCLQLQREKEITMSNSDNTVDAIVQPFVVVNDHVAPSDKSISDSVVELVTFSIKENITTLDVAQDVGTSSVQPNPNAATITESFGDSCDFEAATKDELQDKEKNDIPADSIEDSKTEESIEKVVSLGDKDTESEKTVNEEQEMIDLDELEEAALEATDAGIDENLSVDAGGDNEEEDSEVEDEGNDSPRQCLCVMYLSRLVEMILGCFSQKLPKGEIVGVSSWPHFAKTNIQARCGAECFTIKFKQDVAWNASTLDTTSSGPGLMFLISRGVLFMEISPFYFCTKQHAFPNVLEGGHDLVLFQNESTIYGNKTFDSRIFLKVTSGPAAFLKPNSRPSSCYIKED
ncbi:unnamed protein product [Trifolium pratense]|uniref:Uncharacterized protein n=1 Tax=Trifolium pratense TaxID=57577 RepID=A0ACB0ILA7_TRIPR|nr:unnamed protein product [Trifolium pratense]